MKLVSIVFNLIFLTVVLGACNTKSQDSQNFRELENQCITILRNVLAEQHEWVKVHAAEYLIWAGHPEGVREAYIEEERMWAAKPQYRIGIWRVLAQAATVDADMQIWTDKIIAVFLDSTATDRIHAAETLAKLGISPLKKDQKLTENTLRSEVKPLALYTLWSTAFTSPDSRATVKARFLNAVLNADTKAADRVIPAYALRQLKGISQEESTKLTEAALAEPADSPARIYLLSAAFTNNDHDPAQFEKLHAALVNYKSALSKGAISEMAAALAEKGKAKDIPILTPLLTSASQLENESDRADVAAAAAHAILQIKNRTE